MTVLDDKIILFPSEKEFKIEFLIDEEVSMRGSDKNIHWTIDHNFGTAIVRARTREQAKTICLRLYRCVRMDRVI